MWSFAVHDPVPSAMSRVSVMKVVVQAGSPAWWELRDEWALALVLLGAYGYRPKLTSQEIVGYRGDGSVFTLSVRDDELPILRYDCTLRVALMEGEAEVADDRLPFDGDEHLIGGLLGFLSRHPEGCPPKDGFIRHFMPEGELDRIRLGIGYARYRPYLDALASNGIHAYLEHAALGSMRMYSDVSSSLLLDVSTDDEGLGELGPEGGGWVVFLTGPGGHEAEFTIDQLGDEDENAGLFADAIADALGDVLRGRNIFFEHYDARYGRLDPGWFKPPNA